MNPSYYINLNISSRKHNLRHFGLFWIQFISVIIKKYYLDSHIFIGIRIPLVGKQKDSYPEEKILNNQLRIRKSDLILPLRKIIRAIVHLWKYQGRRLRLLKYHFQGEVNRVWRNRLLLMGSFKMKNLLKSWWIELKEATKIFIWVSSRTYRLHIRIDHFPIVLFQNPEPKWATITLVRRNTLNL